MLKLMRDKEMSLKDKINALRTYIEVKQGKTEYHCPYRKKYGECPYVGGGSESGACYYEKPWHCEEGAIK